MSMEQPEWEDVKNYFRKIMNSFALGLLWMLTAATTGLYFKLAYVADGVRWPNALFYALFVSSFAALLWFFYRTWKG